MSNLDTALALATAGLFVFPASVSLGKDAEGKDKWDKNPLIKWRRAGSTNATQVVRWWSTWPHALPGIELEQCGLVVLDGDRHSDDVDGVEALNDVLGAETPQHPISNSAGNGVHHIFRQPESGEPLGNATGSLPKGVDVRGKGGWIVAPGSVRPDGRVWQSDPGAPSLAEAFASGTIPVVPAHIVAMIRPARQSPRPSISQRAMSGIVPRGGGDAGGRAERYGWSGLANECRTVSTQQSGGRNNQLNVSAFSVGQLVGAGMVERNTAERFLFLAAEQCGLVNDDGADSVRATIASGLTSGMRQPRVLPEQPRSVLRMTIEIETAND